MLAEQQQMTLVIESNGYVDSQKGFAQRMNSMEIQLSKFMKMLSSILILISLLTGCTKLQSSIKTTTQLPNGVAVPLEVEINYIYWLQKKSGDLNVDKDGNMTFKFDTGDSDALTNMSETVKNLSAK